jgi:hypothetical protein
MLRLVVRCRLILFTLPPFGPLTGHSIGLSYWRPRIHQPLSDGWASLWFGFLQLQLNHTVEINYVGRRFTYRDFCQFPP